MKDRVRQYLDSFQSEMAEGFQKCEHKFSKNGTMSCVKCGKTPQRLFM